MTWLFLFFFLTAPFKVNYQNMQAIHSPSPNCCQNLHTPQMERLLAQYPCGYAGWKLSDEWRILICSPKINITSTLYYWIEFILSAEGKALHHGNIGILAMLFGSHLRDILTPLHSSSLLSPPHLCSSSPMTFPPIPYHLLPTIISSTFQPLIPPNRRHLTVLPKSPLIFPSFQTLSTTFNLFTPAIYNTSPFFTP